MRGLKQRKCFLRRNAILVAEPFFTDQYETVDRVVNVSEAANLCPRLPYGERLAGKILLFERLDDRTVSVNAGAFSGSVHIVKIGNRIRQIVPTRIIPHELAIYGFHPGIGREIAAEDSVF